MTAKKRGCESAINAEGQQQAKLPAEMISKQQNKPAAETPLAFIENNLQIQDKAGHLVPLHFNPAQLRLYREIERQQSLGKPVRIIILKARQVGFSTAVAALFYERSARHSNTNSMIVAHKAEASANIFSKAKLFYETSPPEYRPMKRASNARELLFENPSNKQADRDADPGLRSRIRIETAGAKDAGRSATIHNLHLSELAFWPHAAETMLSLMQAVPHDPQTMVIIESTANGVGGEFHQQWLRAVRGESEFVPLFFPWWEHQEYRLAAVPLAGGEESSRTKEEEGGRQTEHLGSRRMQPEASRRNRQGRGRNKARIMLMPRNNGTMRNWLYRRIMVWRQRSCVGGDGVSRPTAAVTRTALPRSIRHRQMRLFWPAGGRFLPAGLWLRLMLRLKNRWCVVNWNGRELIEESLRPDCVRSDGEDWQFMSSRVVWETIGIGVDASSGAAGGDYSAMAVVERKSLLPVAFWQGRIDPDLLGEEAVKLACFYHQAIILPCRSRMVQKKRAVCRQRCLTSTGGYHLF